MKAGGGLSRPAFASPGYASGWGFVRPDTHVVTVRARRMQRLDRRARLRSEPGGDPEHDTDRPPRTRWTRRGRTAAVGPALVARRRGESYTTYAPFTGQPIAALPVSTVSRVVVAAEPGPGRAGRLVAASRWPCAPRSCSAFHDLVLDRQDEILDLIQWESGKARHARVRGGRARRDDRSLLRRTALRHARVDAAAGHLPGVHPGRRASAAQGRRRGHLAMELPLHHGAVGRTGGAAGRQRGRAQAGRPDGGVGALRHRTCCTRPGTAGGPVAGGVRRGAGGRAGGRRQRRLRLLHRLDAHRPRGRRRGRPAG